MTYVQKTENLSSVNVSYHTDARYEQLLAFIDNALNGQTYKLESLPGDASFRRYHRIYLDVPQHNQYPSYIVMDAPPQLESIESFVRVDRLLASKINVPTLVAEDIASGFLLLQDFGKTEFSHLLESHKVNNDFDTIDTLYKLAIDSLIDLQSIPVELAKQSFSLPPYDASMLHREIDLFNDWFLPFIDCRIEGKDQQMWQKFTQELTNQILKQPQVVVHRDYHSRNLMQDQYQPSALGIIDFQDAVIGAYTYDLVSLVRDAYVEWDEGHINQWTEYFWYRIKDQHANGAHSLEQFKSQLNLIGVQRHLKVLGIFVRLSERDGKSRYLADIPKVWRDLLLEMQWLYDNSNEEIKVFITPVYQWLVQKVEPNFFKSFSH